MPNQALLWMESSNPPAGNFQAGEAAEDIYLHAAPQQATDLSCASKTSAQHGGRVEGFLSEQLPEHLPALCVLRISHAKLRMLKSVWCTALDADSAG
eukprot:CAMPEP_0117689380 /NCGR_PEP_ID=MMETSP0804-20121206/24453_1 /TAXON_ID=1074897 /ORGANISM="Tetraselmis astigmatica, Strain CCMP880" /LENGTH=96 /DNA_ID=CAMNT_0005502137 /DNA_START=262 /DNA_END=552 /DNA_ORIENTATION=+